MGYKNKERRNARISATIMVIGIICVVLPSTIDADMMRWGYGVAFIGIFLSITAFLVYLLFRGRAKVLDKMFMNENMLAHWQYSKEFWKTIYDEDMEDSGIMKVAGFFLGGIFLIIGIVVYLANTDENMLFLELMAGIGVFFVIVGFIGYTAEKKRIATSLPEAWISKQGLFFKNVLYTWNNRVISYLEGVDISPIDSRILVINMRQFSGGRGSFLHYHQYTLEIPIPPGQEQSAVEIVKYFGLTINRSDFKELDT